MLDRMRVASKTLVIALLAALLSSISSCASSGGPIIDCFESSPPLCGQECPSACGCSRCDDTQPASCGDGQITRCALGGTCYEILATCADKDSCVGSKCATSSADCDAVRAAYEREIDPKYFWPIVAVVRPGSPPLMPGQYGPGYEVSCDIVPGDCAIGLDTCWFIGDRSGEIERLAALYARLGCPVQTTCNCPAYPLSVTRKIEPGKEVCVVE